MISKEDYLEKFGKPFKEWISQNFKNQKQLAMFLKISPAMLSQMISGDKRIPARIQIQLNKRGFPQKYFDLIEGVADIRSQVLTYDELKEFYFEMKDINQRQRVLIDHLLEDREHLLKKLRSKEIEVKECEQELKSIQRKYNNLENSLQ